MEADDRTIPQTEIFSRITHLQGQLQRREIDGALIVQKTDLFYYSGTGQQGWLYVPAEGKPLLFIFKEFDRAQQESPIENIISIPSIKAIPAQLSFFELPEPKVLGLELDVLPTNLYFQYRKVFSQCRIEDIATEIRLQRAVKSPFEIEKMSLAAALSDRVAVRAAELLVPGKTEVAVAGELEAYARSLGHQGIVRMRMWGAELFYGHLLSGPGAAVPSYLASPTGGQGVSNAIGQGAGYRKIRANEPVLVDYVFALDGYLSDHARIYCFGELDEELVAAHAAMLELQDAVKQMAKPGVSCGDVYDFMVFEAGKTGFAQHFMGVGERRIRFTGHGLGLELDEYPFLAMGQTLPLEDGMVLALEPKTIFPGKGVVGIENTHLVTKDGLVSLTHYPDNITYLH